jgi:transcription elongation factor GreA
MATATATIPQDFIPVTREGHRLLRDQLTALTAQGRADASERVRQARADDRNLAENPELTSALQAQEQLERRISELESQLERAHVIEGASTSGEVVLGTSVHLRPSGSRGRQLEFQLVSSIEADPSRGRLSIESPVGEALLGRRVGETVEVMAPRGVVRFEVMAVEDGSGTARPRPSDQVSDMAVSTLAA